MSKATASPIPRFIATSISLIVMEVVSASALIIGLTTSLDLDLPTFSDFPFVLNNWQFGVFFAIIIVNLCCHIEIFQPAEDRSNKNARRLFLILAAISFFFMFSASLYMDPGLNRVNQLVMLAVSSIIASIKIVIIQVKKPHIPDSNS